MFKTSDVISFEHFIAYFFGRTFAFMQLFLKILSGVANTADPDHTAPIWVYTVCICHFVRNLEKHIGLTKTGLNSGEPLISSGCNCTVTAMSLVLPYIYIKDNFSLKAKVPVSYRKLMYSTRWDTLDISANLF